MTLPMDRVARAFNTERDMIDFLWPPGVGIKKGIAPHLQVAYQSAPFTLANSTALQAAFAATNDSLLLTAATTYMVEGLISHTTGATSHTEAFSLLGAGTATLTSAAIGVSAAAAAAATPVAPVDTLIEVGTAVVVTAAITAVRTVLKIFGSFQCLAAGTMIPSIQFSADPTGTLTTNVGSFFRIYPIGSNVLTGVGNWT